MDSVAVLRPGPGEGSRAADFVAVEGRTGSLVLRVRQAVRHGRMRGYRRASRSVLLTVLGARSSEVDRRVPCSG